MRRAMFAVLVVAVGAMAPWLAVTRAGASCAAPDPNAKPIAVDYLARSEVAFLGQVIASEVVDVRAVNDGVSGSPAIRWTFVVHEVYKGRVARRQQLVTDEWAPHGNRPGGACTGGLNLRYLHQYVVYGCRPPGYALLICGGTFEPDGQNTLPLTVPSHPPSAIAAAAAVAQAPEPDAKSGTSPWALVASALSGAAATLTLLVGWRRRRAPTR